MTYPLINITRKQAFIFAFFLVLYESLTYIANDMLMPGMIKVVESFNASDSAIASSLTFYILGGASLQLVLGPVSDCYGRRPVMIFGAFFFCICTLLIACTHSIDQFLVARFFQGMGLCFICVVGYATLQEIFDEMDAIRLIAILANVSILAPLLGPLIGAVFINYFDWRFIFILIGLTSIVALLGLWKYMPESIGQIKRNGEQIKRIPLSLHVVGTNYKKLFLNRTFMMGTIGMGLLCLPCVAWIALAPVILVSDANLSIIQYGLWQLPVFTACIIGNIVLRRMTHYCTIEKLTWIGSIIAGISLLVMFLLPLLIGNFFIWLLPGLIVYFFGYGIAGGPLCRFILFSTSVSKGTASALMSMIAMCIQAAGIEVINLLYLSHSNRFFGFYCAIVGLVYLLFLSGAFYFFKYQ